MTHPISITVVVPSYRRPNDLLRCLRALDAQTRPPQEINVTVRTDDAETRMALSQYLHERPNEEAAPLRVIDVTQPGMVQALNASIRAATGSIIALTDDDAAPHPDWLQRIEAAFASDDKIGGVGGRDQIFVDGERYEGDVRRAVVGQVQWFGRVAGNHHVGFGVARPAEFLKGVNSAYRAEPLKRIGFDARCAGSGTHINSEIPLGFAFLREGWRLIYDPEIVVDHYPAARFDEDHRREFNALAQRNRVYNETLFLLEALPFARCALYFAWAIAVGAASEPGLLQVARLALTRRPAHLLARFQATMQGRAKGLREVLRQGSRRINRDGGGMQSRPSPVGNKTL